MQSWDIIVEKNLSGADNMAIDEVLMNQVRAGKSNPVLRFYTWEPACLSLGFFQRASKEIDFAACEKEGIDVVRRATGGRAVLHDEELTYSVIVREDNELVPKTITQSYLSISKGLLQGFHHLGIEANLSSEETIRVKDFRSAACFEAPSSYEVVVGNKKIVGSAQVRKEGMLLQHGAIVNRMGVDKLFSLFKVDNPKKLDVMKKFLLGKATSVEEVLGHTLLLDEMIEAFAKGLSDSLTLELTPRGLTEEERTLVKLLVAEKYGNKDWTHRK